MATAKESVEGLTPIYEIDDSLIEDGSYVVFDWDNTLKLYNKVERKLTSRVSREFLYHLKRDRGCKLYIISAIRPSAINLSTILSEVEKLGLTDVFVGNSDENVVKANEYASKGTVIICGYDKAETFLNLSGFDASRGDTVQFFDDESVNIYNFRAIVPTSKCYWIQ